MAEPLFPSTIGTQSRFPEFLTTKIVVRKIGQSDGQTRSRCLDKPVLAQGEGEGEAGLGQLTPPWHLVMHTFPVGRPPWW